jgi:hypothetical protein
MVAIVAYTSRYYYALVTPELHCSSEPVALLHEFLDTRELQLTLAEFKTAGAGSHFLSPPLHLHLSSYPFR